MLSLAVSVFTLLLSPQTAPQTTPQIPPAATAEDSAVHVRWAVPPRPRPSDFPSAALRRGQSGRVVVRCAVGSGDRPNSCVVVGENPADAGFGQAALRVVQRARFDPASIVESDIGKTFEVRVPFNAPR